VTPQQFLLALRARLGVFTLVLAATVLAATVASFLLPKTFRATASLLVESKDEQSLSNALPLILPQEKLSYLQTQAEIIVSKRVARRVVQDMKLADNPSTRTAFEKAGTGNESIEDWLVEALLLRVKVETSLSSIINVSYSSPDPRFSARVADAFAKAYIDTVLELRVEPTKQAAQWYDEQLKSLRANLESAQAKLTDYLQREGIVSTDERFDIDNTRLSALSDQVVKAQEQTIQWNAREEQAGRFVERGGAPDRLPEILDNPFIQKLKADLLQGEMKLHELSTQYGSNYPQYQRQLSENQGLRRRLDAEMRKVVEGIRNSARQSRQRETELKKALATQRARLLELKDNRNEFTVLRRNVESAERAYDTAMQRHVVSQVESRASQTNVTILNAAAVPGKPTQPKIALNIALSVVVGIMLGVTVTLVMELLDRRVRSPGDLDLDVPLLVVLNAWRPAQDLLGGPKGPSRALPKPA
jgi:chain length determinant protein EpsF